MAPAPGHEVKITLIIGPSRPLAQLPTPLPKIVMTQETKQLGIESLKAWINRLLRETPQKDRKPDTPPFELAVMEQDRPRQGSHCHGRRSCLGGRERRRGTRLIMIFEEADEPLLVT